MPDPNGEDLPTQPLPSDDMVAAHVPVADLPTAPLTPPAGADGVTAAPSPVPQRSAPRTWLWVIIAAVAAGLLAAVITGLLLDRGATPVPSPSTSTVAPSPSASTAPPADDDDGEETPVPPPPAPDPTQPPAPTEPPTPTEPPAPTEPAAP